MHGVNVAASQTGRLPDMAGTKYDCGSDAGVAEALRATAAQRPHARGKALPGDPLKEMLQFADLYTLRKLLQVSREMKACVPGEHNRRFVEGRYVVYGYARPYGPVDGLADNDPRDDDDYYYYWDETFPDPSCCIYERLYPDFHLERCGDKYVPRVDFRRGRHIEIDLEDGPEPHPENPGVPDPLVIRLCVHWKTDLDGCDRSKMGVFVAEMQLNVRSFDEGRQVVTTSDQPSQRGVCLKYEVVRCRRFVRELPEFPFTCAYYSCSIKILEVSINVAAAALESKLEGYLRDKLDRDRAIVAYDERKQLKVDEDLRQTQELAAMALEDERLCPLQAGLMAWSAAVPRSSVPRHHYSKPGWLGMT